MKDDTPKKVVKKSPIVIVVIIILSLIHLIFKQDSQLNNEVNYREAIFDSLQVWKDKAGNYKARISTIQSQRTDDFLKLDSLSEEIVELQEAVKKAKEEGGLKAAGSSVTIIKTNTDISEKLPSTIDTSYSELAIRSNVDLDGWVVGSVLARRDTTELNIRIKDEFTVRLDYEKSGFLGMGRSKPFTELTSKNPYSRVKTLRSYQVTLPEEPNLIIGPSIGFGYPGWFFGVTATYPLIRLKL